VVAATGTAMNSPRILVVGAGPTGMALALQAHSLGATVRVVEQRPQAFRPSRAMMLHSRSLEMLRPLGAVDALLDRADTAPRMRLQIRGRSLAIELSSFDITDTPYPHLSLIRQADVESVLADALAARDVMIERGVQLHNITAQPGDGIRADLHGTAEPVAAVDYLAGCDGTDSTVRSLATIPTTDRRYRRDVVLADVELDGPLTPGVAHVSAGPRGLVFVFPHGDRATWRLLATKPASGGPAGRAVPPAHLQHLLDGAHLPVQVSRVAWSSVVPLRHVLAGRYRRSRVFLAGDAAHTHSPAGGQGMNTGLQDGLNLGWKLAFAATSADPETLLDSYEQERRPVARTTMALTDMVFWGESGLDPLAVLARTVLVPLSAPLLSTALGWRRPTAMGFRTLAQLRIGYPDSTLSIEDGASLPGPAAAGDRLPDAPVTVDTGPTRLHELTAKAGVHLLLSRDAPDVDHLSDDPRVHLHRLLDRPGRGLVVVRPDGHIGLRTADAASPAVGRWLALAGVTRTGDATAR
jgi:2-polyprenyl-6-methoxyphenol hydroxylase-like FAD-dependent oxidoreductase